MTANGQERSSEKSLCSIIIKHFHKHHYSNPCCGSALWYALIAGVPDAETMGLIGILALAANLIVAAMLCAFHEGNSNMRSVRLCTRDDALGNVAVIVSALGVFGTGSAWPDLGVAIIMATLALHSSWNVIRHARIELIST